MMAMGMRTALMAAALVCVPATADAQKRGRQPDAESLRSMRELFATVDTNGDGQVTRAEGNAYIGNRRVSHANRNRIWRELDTDRSGTVSRAEFIAQAMKYEARMQVR